MADQLLAREIVAMSRPQDRPSDFLISIENEGFVFEATSPTVNGKRVLVVTKRDDGNELLLSATYDVNDIEGAARLVEGSLRNIYPHGGVCNAEMYRVSGNVQSQEGERISVWPLEWPEFDDDLLHGRLGSIFKALLGNLVA